jgi:DNA-damage-inducible protein D
MPGADGKMYLTDAVNTETLFRVIQSIPSKKAEPFKRWLARVGYERIQEFQDPEISVKRAIINWQIQGRSDDWIEARLRSIVVRHELGDARRGLERKLGHSVVSNRNFLKPRTDTPKNLTGKS